MTDARSNPKERQVPQPNRVQGALEAWDAIGQEVRDALDLGLGAMREKEGNDHPKPTIGFCAVLDRVLDKARAAHRQSREALQAEQPEPCEKHKLIGCSHCQPFVKERKLCEECRYPVYGAHAKDCSVYLASVKDGEPREDSEAGASGSHGPWTIETCPRCGALAEADLDQTAVETGWMTCDNDHDFLEKETVLVEVAPVEQLVGEQREPSALNRHLKALRVYADGLSQHLSDAAYRGKKQSRHDERMATDCAFLIGALNRVEAALDPQPPEQERSDE